MGSIESGIRDLLDLVGKQRDELDALRDENSYSQSVINELSKHNDMLVCALSEVIKSMPEQAHDIAKEALK